MDRRPLPLSSSLSLEDPSSPNPRRSRTPPPSSTTSHRHTSMSYHSDLLHEHHNEASRILHIALPIAVIIYAFLVGVPLSTLTNKILGIAQYAMRGALRHSDYAIELSAISSTLGYLRSLLQLWHLPFMMTSPGSGIVFYLTVLDLILVDLTLAARLAFKASAAQMLSNLYSGLWFWTCVVKAIAMPFHPVLFVGLVAEGYVANSFMQEGGWFGFHRSVPGSLVAVGVLGVLCNVISVWEIIA